MPSTWVWKRATARAWRRIGGSCAGIQGSRLAEEVVAPVVEDDKQQNTCMPPTDGFLPGLWSQSEQGTLSQTADRLGAIAGERLVLALSASIFHLFSNHLGSGLSQSAESCCSCSPASCAADGCSGNFFNRQSLAVPSLTIKWLVVGDFVTYQELE